MAPKKKTKKESSECKWNVPCIVDTLKGLLKENPLYIIIAVTAVVVIGAIIIANDKTAGTYEAEVQDEMKFFTNFRDHMNDVTAIRMIAKGQVFNVEKVNDQWLLPDRHAYPVGIDKVRDIVLNASELEILEKKTDDPERLDVLGLDDPQKEESEAVQITLYDQSGTALADFVVGKRRRNGGRTFYARNVDESQAYLVKGDGWLTLDLSPGHWLNSESFRVDKDRVEKVTFKYPDKKNKDFTIARSHAGARKFRIDDLGKRKIISDSDVTDAAFSISSMALVGVAPASHIDFSPKETVTTIYKMFDGMEVTFQSTEDKDGDRWVKIEATADGPGVKPETRDDAAQINRTVKDWVYIISKESAKLLTSKLEELTEL